MLHEMLPDYRRIYEFINHFLNKVEHLITKATFERVDDYGRTLAYSLNNENLTKFAHFIDINHQDNDGKTLLHATFSKIRTLLLLKLGANPLVMDNKYKIPREGYYAIDVECFTILRQRENECVLKVHLPFTNLCKEFVDTIITGT
jgi:hypothetical protein